MPLIFIFSCDDDAEDRLVWDSEAAVSPSECVFVCYLSPRSSPVDISTPGSCPHLHFSQTEWNHHRPWRLACISIIIDHRKTHRSAPRPLNYRLLVKLQPHFGKEGFADSLRTECRWRSDEGVAARRRRREVQVPGEIYKMKVRERSSRLPSFFLSFFSPP